MTYTIKSPFGRGPHDAEFLHAALTACKYTSETTCRTT